MGSFFLKSFIFKVKKVPAFNLDILWNFEEGWLKNERGDRF